MTHIEVDLRPQFEGILYVLPSRDYAEAWAATGGRAWYEALGFKPRGFAQRRGGAWRIYVDRDARGLVSLVAHELGHLRGLEHPTTPLAAVLHAIANGFPTMAFTGLLRWRDPEGLRPVAERILRRAGVL